MPEKFVLNDEQKVNSYGFRLPNKGGDLKRFKANPVMLDQHYNSTSSVLGKWNDVTIEGGTLTAEPEFDEQDEKALAIKGKVERGYIKGASLGVTFNREYMKQAPDGVWELTKYEVFEASIVAIPSNASALRLYAAETGALMTEEDVKLCLSALSTDANFNNEDMKQITLSIGALMALGFNQQPTENDGVALSAAIEKLKLELDNEKLARKTLLDQVETAAKLKAKTLVDEAVLSGKITAAVHGEFQKMAESNYELAATVLGGMQSKKGLAGSVDNPAGNGADPKNMDEFEKLSLADQLAFKANSPDAYKKLFA